MYVGVQSAKPWAGGDRGIVVPDRVGIAVAVAGADADLRVLLEIAGAAARERAREHAADEVDAGVDRGPVLPVAAEDAELVADSTRGPARPR